MEATDISDTHPLKALIKEILQDVLREERSNLCQLLMPYVSDDEQTEIDHSLGAPNGYDEDGFVDLTSWVRHGGSIEEL